MRDTYRQWLGQLVRAGVVYCDEPPPHLDQAQAANLAADQLLALPPLLNLGLVHVVSCTLLADERLALDYLTAVPAESAWLAGEDGGQPRPVCHAEQATAFAQQHWPDRLLAIADGLQIVFWWPQGPRQPLRYSFGLAAGLNQSWRRLQVPSPYRLRDNVNQALVAVSHHPAERHELAAGSRLLYYCAWCDGALDATSCRVCGRQCPRQAKKHLPTMPLPSRLRTQLPGRLGRP